MPKILLVEDNEMNRDMLSRRLARRGDEFDAKPVDLARLLAKIETLIERAAGS